MVSPVPPGASLNRSVTLLQLTLFGSGTILGAGIYVLIGKVAGEAGLYTPLAFLCAAAIAAVTAFSYAEISSRYPRSAGEATYVLAAFNSRLLSMLVGYALVLTGIVSSATLANGFVGYFQVLLPLPATLLVVLSVTAVGAIAVWGIQQSMIAAACVTLIEIAGLLLVIVVAGDSLATLPAVWPDLLPGFEALPWLGIMSGCVLAFYAFMGFEDMVNVAEEVIRPEITMPRAILLAFALATSLYVLIALLAVLALPLGLLADSEAPFALLMQQRGHSPTLISLISLVAIINGALVQMIMASRVLYGLACQGSAPLFLGRINRVTKTPVIATVLVIGCVIGMALIFRLESLARITSFIVLLVFTLVNLSLVKIKGRPGSASPGFSVPVAVPWLGAALSLMLLLFAAFV
ncbi:MAG: amino acid permease [Pseudomonadales bacterium]|nr:amino acid permease [Gammaproteobacteria bacterium]NNL57631.1 amino acid permease [Pseudomonadales bacterium]